MKKISSKKELIKLLNSKKNFLEKEFGIKKISFFGSFAREKINDKSDIDILIDVKNSKKTLFNRLKIKKYLENISGRKIDLTYYDTLHPVIKESSIKDMINV